MKYWKNARLATDFRESILRVAAYKSFLEQMKADPKGRPESFCASVPVSVMALPKLGQRAFKLQNELLGAYDQVSVHGQWLRKNAFPFWSWKEVNMKIYGRLLQNAIRDPNAMEQLGKRMVNKRMAARLTGATAARIGIFTMKVFALQAMLAAWNHSTHHDLEENLPDEIRSRAHIIFGKDPKTGETLLFTNVGALNDLLSAFGLSGYKMYIDKYAHGEMTLKEIAVEMAKEPVNQVIMGIYPIQKALFEVATRRSMFPDVFQPRTIRDRGGYLARSLGYERSEEHTSELQSHSFISYAVFCLKKKKKKKKK